MADGISTIIQKIIKAHVREKGELPDSREVTRQLVKQYPDAVERYLNSHRQTLLHGAVTRAMSAERNNLRSSQLMKRLADGTADAVFDLERFWTTAFYVPGNGWKGLGDLTGRDHEAIADRYELGAVAMSLRAELHRELAQKVGAKTTKDVYKPKLLAQQISMAYDTHSQLGGS